MNDHAEAPPVPADPAARLGSKTADFLVATIPAAALGVVLHQAFGGAVELRLTDRSWMAVHPLLLTHGLLVYLWFVATEARWGAAPVRRRLGLEVRTGHGGPPGVGTSAVRNAWQLAPVVPFVGYLVFAVIVVGTVVSIVRGPHGCGWHDRLAGTVIVRSDARRARR